MSPSTSKQKGWVLFFVLNPLFLTSIEDILEKEKLLNVQKNPSSGGQKLDIALLHRLRVARSFWKSPTGNNVLPSQYI